MEYTLIRSSRRTLSLEIAPDLTVLVRAPHLCGKGRIDRFVEAHRDWIDRHMAAAQRRQKAQQARQVSAEEEARLRCLAQAYIPQRVAVFARQMAVAPAGVRITSAQKRFGSCSGKNSLCFSWRLMQYPPEAVDYVVVHELAHVIHHDHSAAFWALVEKHMPDYRQRQDLLRD
ncbi:MAG: M48 family metallopeptidase [Ruminococcaceae bacterium]|nr:M48 family metallopeptidase [Oscillospiraceae bacterium]